MYVAIVTDVQFLNVHWLIIFSWVLLVHNELQLQDNSVAESVGCLLEFYILATSQVMSGWVSPIDGAYSWWFYSAVPLGNQTASTMTWYPTQSHYPSTVLTSLYTILFVRYGHWCIGVIEEIFAVYFCLQYYAQWATSRIISSWHSP